MTRDEALKLRGQLQALYKDLTGRQHDRDRTKEYRERSEIICERMDLHEKLAIAHGQWGRAGQAAYDAIAKASA